MLDAMAGFFHNGIVVGVCYTVGAALIIFVVRAGVQTFQGHQVKDQADRDLKVFLMGNQYNPGGWVGKVDKSLEAITDQLTEIGKAAGVERKRVHEKEGS